MSNSRTEFVFRHNILGMLSDDEVASVSTAETAMGLADGEEYLDLERLDRGVRPAAGTFTPMGRVLFRRAVGEATWNKVLSQLEAYRAATLHFGVGRGTNPPSAEPSGLARDRENG
jgi:hypothetical protein